MIEPAVAGLLAVALGLLAAFSPYWVPLGLLGILAGVLLLFLRPRTVFAALLVLYTIYPWLSAVVFPLLPPIGSAAASALKEAALLGLVAVALGRSRLWEIPSRISIPFLAFSVLILLLVFIPASPMVPSLLSARFHLQYLLLLPVAAALSTQREHRRSILVAIVGSGSFIAVVWLSALGWAGLGELEYSMATTKVLLGENSTVTNSINVLGTYLAILLCVLLGLLVHAAGWGGRAVLLALIFVLGWALLSTFSRRAIVALLAAAIVISVISKLWRLLMWGGVAAVVVMAYASSEVLRRFSISAADSTRGVSLRVEHFWYTLSNLDPLTVFVGHGIGTAGVVAMNAGVPGAVDLHNYYLLLLFEAGLVGIILYLVMCAIAFRSLLTKYRAAAPESPDRGLLLGTLGALVAFLLAGAAGVTNATLPVAPILWALVGCALAVRDPGVATGADASP